MEWITIKDRIPEEKDSPILAWGDDIQEGYLNCAVLHWLNDEDGWKGEGWYGHSNEYGMDKKEIKYWIPLPKPKIECNKCKIWNLAAIENGYRMGMCEECFNRNYVSINR